MNILSLGWRRSPAMFAVAILCGAVSGACSAGLIVIIHRAMSADAAARVQLAWAFLGLAALAPIMRFFSQVMLVRLTQAAMYQLMMGLASQVLGAPLRKLEEIGRNKITAVLTTDVAAVANGLTSLPALCLQTATLLTGLVYLGSLSIRVMLGFVAVTTVAGLTLIYPVSRASRLLRRAREEADGLLKQFAAMVDGAKELKLHARRRHAFYYDVLDGHAQSYRQLNAVASTTYSAATGWGQFLFYGLLGLVMFVLPAAAGVPAAAASGYALVLLYLLVPIDTIGNTLPILGRANASLAKVSALGLAFPPMPAATAQPPRALDFTRSLRLRGVTHTYFREVDNSVFELGPIDLTLHPGELLFIAGANGSGKTTLAKLLTGLYVSEHGEILVDDVPVRDETRERYRNLFSAVFSDFYLFDPRLAAEQPKDLDARANAYISQVHLTHKVQLQQGVFTTTDLSHGQRKRLSLVSAYLEDRPIYLFDEWAADQDPLFKDFFYLHLLPDLKARGKAICVITHDDRYYHLADRLIRLVDGAIEETTSPHALARTAGS
jgi:putative pyoverdin transport system ATP-binding/permease protein